MHSTENKATKSSFLCCVFSSVFQFFFGSCLLRHCAPSCTLYGYVSIHSRTHTQTQINIECAKLVRTSAKRAQKWEKNMFLTLLFCMRSLYFQMKDYYNGIECMRERSRARERIQLKIRIHWNDLIYLKMERVQSVAKQWIDKRTIFSSTISGHCFFVRLRFPPSPIALPSRSRYIKRTNYIVHTDTPLWRRGALASIQRLCT